MRNYEVRLGIDAITWAKQTEGSKFWAAVYNAAESNIRWSTVPKPASLPVSDEVNNCINDRPRLERGLKALQGEVAALPAGSEERKFWADVQARLQRKLGVATTVYDGDKRLLLEAKKCENRSP